MTPRHLAITILSKRQETGLPVDQIRDQLVDQAEETNRKDIQLVTAIVYGVLRQQRLLDSIIADFSKHPLKKMKNLTLQALRVGLFQLCFMDRIPASAAVNETVKALRTARQPKWLTGFVNGLLRSIARKVESGADLVGAKKLPAAVRYSHPDWLYKRWLSRYGEDEATRICQTNNSQPPLCLRVNTRVTSREEFVALLKEAGIQATVSKLAPEAVLLPGFKGNISMLPGYTNGSFMVQDEGAQLISLMLAPLSPGKCLDACAGLGGKTIHLAHMLPQESKLIAIEPAAARFNLLHENISRMELSGLIDAHQTTLAAYRKKADTLFQSILVDAPCSGLGVIRRQPDIRWNRQSADLKRYQATQLELLRDAAALLAPGGAMVYATCSTEPEENDDVVRLFLQAHADFSLTKDFLRLLPDQSHDGFFAARLEKTVQSEECKV